MPLTLGFGLNLNSVVTVGDVEVSTVSLPNFTYQTETETLTSTFTTAPTSRRKKTIDWAISTLKGNNYRNASPWNKMIAFYKVGNDLQSSIINWITPGTHNLVAVGSPTFTKNVSFSTSNGAAFNTGINLNSLDPTKMGMFVHSVGVTNSSSSDCGALNSDGSGLTISVLNSASSSMTARCGGSNVTTLGSSIYWNNSGVVGVSRQSSTSFTAYRGSVLVTTQTQNNSTMTAVPIHVCGINNNGTISSAPRAQTSWAILNDSLTADEATVLANVMYELDFQFNYGELDDYPAGYAPTTVDCDLLVYGGTAAAVTAAYEGARQGLNVAILGGWRDSQIGGMPASGVGLTDWANTASIGGLPLWMLNQLQTLEGTGSTNFNFEPKYFRAVAQMMFDPRVTYGKDVPVYWSNGISSVSTSNSRVNSLTTNDGRTFNFSYWIDTSYEGDLLVKSGIPVTIGREANTTYGEPNAGYIGTSSASGYGDGAPHNHSNVDTVVNPYVTSGNTSSGLLPTVQKDYNLNTPPAMNSSDDNIQSYNFRLTLTTNAAWGIPFPSTSRTGYSNTTFEALGRLFGSDSTMTLNDILKMDAINTSGYTVYDVNNKNGFSTDFIGQSKNYPAANNSTRETIWQNHWNYILDLFYYLQYDPDVRIPSAVRTAALTYRIDSRHYTRPNIRDDFQTPPQLYVRESYRMVNDFMLRQTDLTQVDGTTPRSTNTISTVSYQIDSHAVQAIADSNSGTPRIYNEGILAVGAGGLDQTSPIPYEAIVPNKSDCENGLVTSSIAASHVAYCGYRLELPMMQAGQSAAIAVKVAINNGNQAVQDVSYTTLRAALLSSNTNSGEISPYLPQTN